MTTLHVDGARILNDGATVIDVPAHEDKDGNLVDAVTHLEDQATHALTDAAGGSANVAATANGIAHAFAIAGDAFTFKADGVVLDPNGVMPADVAVLELVEHVNDETPAPVVAVAPAVDDGDDDKE